MDHTNIIMTNGSTSEWGYVLSAEIMFDKPSENLCENSMDPSVFDTNHGGVVNCTIDTKVIGPIGGEWHARPVRVPGVTRSEMTVYMCGVDTIVIEFAHGVNDGIALLRMRGIVGTDASGRCMSGIFHVL